MRLNLDMTRRQKAFYEADADEVLFGGAAGGGKSHGQVLDALLCALKYPRSKQLILRRTFSELDKSIIRTVLGMYPKEIFRFNASAHIGKFTNGSLIDFGYIAHEKDVYQYQSTEYDIIRFDELTHFTETQYTYLLTRIRGVNGYPKQIKSTTNPGGVGHAWVKERFIDPAPPDTLFRGAGGLNKIFLPARVQDNPRLMESDLGYIDRLGALSSENERRALLYGDWDFFEGQYFNEFRRDVHVCDPFEIPSHWRRYRAIDYGLDMFACLFVAVSPAGEAYVYRECGGKDITIGDAARLANEKTLRDEQIYATLAPPDLWGRSQESGRSRATLFYDAGLNLTKSSNDRESGWLAIKELFATRGASGVPRLHIFSNCRELIRCIPALVRDPKNPTDCATEPHEFTHFPDALRYFANFWWRPNRVDEEKKRMVWTPDMYEDYYNAGPAEKEMLRRRWGEPM